ncbi:MAG: fluoride efflux transporter CrcB [Bacteroidota bacterium]
MINIVAVFIGGGLGSLFRYGIAQWLAPYKLNFPYATIIANILACFVLGFFLAFTLKTEMPTAQKLFFMVGFCGGFSTFSTFTAETFHLMQAGNYTYAFLNIACSLLLCLISLYAGLLVGKMLVN